MFADLVVLKDKDVEADFFENIRHIQVHDEIFLKEKKCPTNQLILTDFVQHWLLQDVTFIHVQMYMIEGTYMRIFYSKK